MIAVGIAVSMIWYERRLLSPGGVIVPGMVALTLLIDRPILIFYTLIVSFLTVIFIRWLANHVILFGRRRFSTIMLASFAFVWVLEMVVGLFQEMGVIFAVIGFIIPGLIANEMERQGVLPTLQTLAIISMVTFLIVFALLGWQG